MQLQALHHITMITGDAQRNVDFFAGTLGLRLVKKTVNFDAPEAYHLYFGDEAGSPGTLLTWFQFAGARPGRAGAGMLHTIELGVPSAASLDFWAARLAERGVEVVREDERLRFADPDGLALELVVAQNPPLAAVAADVPAEHAIGGVEGARAYWLGEQARDTLHTGLLGFEALGEGHYVLRGDERSVRFALEAPPEERGRQGAGTIHHIAWHARDEDHLVWQERLREAGVHVTDVRDRDYFKAIYFREPNGLLFELATTSPGFAVDEDPAHLGEALRLPPQHEHLREQLERTLVPVVNPRVG